MFFEKNVQAMLQTDEAHSSLVAQLQAISATTEYQLFETEDGFCTLAYKGVFLHDPHSPVDEVRTMLEAQCHPGQDRIHVILGLGMGYLLDETYTMSAGHIVVYEPDLSFLRFMLENVDLSSLLGSGRVWLVGTQTELLTHIRKKLYRQYQLDVLLLRGYAHLLAEEIPVLMNRITELEADRIYDAKTGRAFHFQWLQQFLNNLPHFAAMDTIDDLQNRYPGKPALVISRGPSLDSNLEAIRAQAGSAVLIAVGGAVRRLWEADITPDYAVFYDANGMQEQLEGVPAEVLEKITFLVSPFVPPCVFESPAYGKRLFLGQNNAQFADWLDVALGRKHLRLDGGGTVSIIGFQMALVMGCNPVILVGQDLAFPNHQVYAGGVALQQDAQGNLALTSTATLYAQPETMDTTTGQNGETLLTLKAYNSFIRHLQDLAVQNAQSEQPATLYNASLGGAHIEGFTLQALTLLKDEFPAAWKADSPTAPAALSARQIEERQLAFQKGLLDLKGQLQQAWALCGQLIEALQDKQLNSQQSLTLIQATNRQFNEFIGNHPFVGYWLMYEMIDFRETISRLTSTPAFLQQGYPALLTMLKGCQEIIQQKALPVVEETYQTLSLKQHAGQAQVLINQS
jgi:hypothetical protein